MSLIRNTGFKSELGPPLSGGTVPGPMLRWKRAAWAGAACSWRGAGAAGCRAAPGPCPPPPRPPHPPAPPLPHAACSSAGLQHGDDNNFFIYFYEDFLFFCGLYSALLHLPPLRFHCAEGCWDRSQDPCNWLQSDALTTRLDLIRMFVSRTATWGMAIMTRWMRSSLVVRASDCQCTDP
jgi:hypothetical protein